MGRRKGETGEAGRFLTSKEEEKRKGSGAGQYLSGG
jgi:hypothetical protein